MSSPPPTNIGLNCVIFGEDTNDVFIIDIPPKATVSALKKLIFKEEADLETRVKWRSLALFQLDLPWNNGLLLDEFKRTILCALPVKCLQVNHTLDKIFPLPLNNDNLHIVVVPPDVAQEAIVGSLENQYGALFERLQVVVLNPGVWKESDVTNNLKGGEIITPDMPRRLECEKMTEFEENLNQHRTYTRFSPYQDRPAICFKGRLLDRSIYVSALLFPL
ncbi:hypothetical protein BD779DRAFT_1578639 [Infundibulicybe gibba]|nr:hypothetical protein BD779DRAFT_1578639 [Infundibulicybe gibba]